MSQSLYKSSSDSGSAVSFEISGSYGAARGCRSSRSFSRSPEVREKLIYAGRGYGLVRAMGLLSDIGEVGVSIITVELVNTISRYDYSGWI